MLDAIGVVSMGQEHEVAEHEARGWQCEHQYVRVLLANLNSSVAQRTTSDKILRLHALACEALEHRPVCCCGGGSETRTLASLQISHQLLHFPPRLLAFPDAGTSNCVHSELSGQGYVMLC